MKLVFAHRAQHASCKGWVGCGRVAGGHQPPDALGEDEQVNAHLTLGVLADKQAAELKKLPLNSILDKNVPFYWTDVETLERERRMQL